MKKYKLSIRLIEVILLLLFGFIITGLDGCSCNRPFIEKVEVWTYNDETDEFDQQVIPSGITYTVPPNTRFCIKIKTQEALTENEINNSRVIIQADSDISLPIEYLEDLTYKAEPTSFLDPGNYNTIIYISHNNQSFYQTIILNIQQ